MYCGGTRTRCVRLVVWLSLLVMSLLVLSTSVLAKTKVTMWIGSEPADMAAWYDQFVKDFNATHSDIELEVTLHASVSAMRDKVIVASAAGVGPDVFCEG